ncbi:MAG: SIS domain-containing protein [Chloroflexi bacterium]|nr:SIS domain-containing protein [Chloroflexota bacterium]
MHTIPHYLEKLRQMLDQLPLAPLEEFIAILLYARAHGNTVFFMGNGGSGSTASHFATDLGKGTAPASDTAGVPRFKVFALNDPSPTFSAYANDMGYQTVFAEQLRAWVKRGDIVVGLSTSGQSRNVLAAMKVAREAGAVCVGFTGFDGGQLKGSVNLSLHVPGGNVGQIEDAHHILMHLVCHCIREHDSADPYPLPGWVEAQEWGLRVR